MAEINKEFLTDLKEKFQKVEKLLEEEHKFNATEEPTVSYENAYDILTEALRIVTQKRELAENNSEEYLIYEIIEGYLYKEHGRVDNLLNRYGNAQSNLVVCLEILKDRMLEPNAVIHCMAAKIELGLCTSALNKNVEARQHLESAEQLYQNFKATGKIPVTILELVSSLDDIEKREGRLLLGKLYTMTTYYLAQVLSKLEETGKSAAYCHITLKRQLKADDYSPIEWALNAATLSQYYLTPNRFTEARHHLAAATHVMLEHESKMITPEMSYDEEQAAHEAFNHRFADIARCWTKYCLALLTASKERLMAEEDFPTSPEKAAHWQFNSLKLPPYEVTDKYCLTFDDAKPVYNFTMKWIERSKQYYNSELEATEYTKIISDEADVYKILAFFEDDPQVQCKYHKKRADLYEHVLSLLNPKFYLLLCRQAWFEAAMAYSTMMDTKLDLMKATEDPTPHQRKKVNTLAEKAITHLQSLLSSFNEKSSIPEDEMRIYLCAHFYIGRLFYKILTPDRKLQLKNLRNSYKYYDLFVIKCGENKEAGDGLKGEVGVCKEMLTLLPIKIETLVKEIGGSGDDN